jgi:large subunit ribosomal protein L25
MKSITIKGSERESVGKKLRLKPYVMLEWFLACYTEEDQPVHFSAEERAFKNLVYTPNAHTVVMNWVKTLTMQFTRHSSAPCY